MFKEFKTFAMKGNVLDLAIGVIIGTAFGKIVTSFVNDIIMPLITIATGNVDFKDMFFALNGQHYNTLAEAKLAGVSTINYGLFITNITDFVIIAFVIFIFVKQIERIKKKPEEPPITTKECEFCKSTIHLEAVKCPNCTSSVSP